MSRSRTVPMIAMAVVAVGLLTAIPTLSQASIVGPQEVGVEIFDLQGQRLGWSNLHIPDHAKGPGGRWQWEFRPNGGHEIRGQGGQVLMTLHSISCTIIEDPAVALDFSITNGTAADMIVSFSSPVLGFSAINNPDAYATAGITVTDLNGNGAQATGQLAGSKAYEAAYNGAPTIWASLIDPVTVLAYDTDTGRGRRPGLPTVWETINASVSSIQSQFNFKLSARDSASGTSYFEITPEPATLALLGLGAIGLVLRRRR